jgi:hypothetical protein
VLQALRSVLAQLRHVTAPAEAASSQEDSSNVC